MRCRSCDTEIDDKALICFRCGAATSDPVHRPVAAPPGRARTLVPVLLGALFLAGAGWLMKVAGDGVPVSPAVWVMLGAAGVLLAWRLRFRYVT